MSPQTYAGLVLTVAESPDASVMGLPMTALQKSGFLPNSGAKGSAHLCAGPVSTNTKCVTFVVACTHAGLSQKEEILTLEPAEALDSHQNDASGSSNRGGETDCRLGAIVISNSEPN